MGAGTPTTKVSGDGPDRRHALGIVLSGGGARGIAHIGVLRALLERGIAPTCIAGVSAGAIVGALYASGYSPAKMLEFFQTTDPYRLANFAFSKPGIYDTAKYVPAFRQWFPEDSFSRLRHELHVLATDFLRGEPVTFTHGPLVLPLLASSAVPMVFSPVEIDGRFLGDGGIIDNFPVQLIASRCQRLIGVHVSPMREVKVGDLGNSLSVLERALEVGMFVKAREEFTRCDLVIHPRRIDQFGMFETKRIVEIEAAGYEETVGRLPAIERLMAAGPTETPQRTAHGGLRT